MSKPKLPALPYSLLETLTGEEINEVRAYAEEAVRQALAAQECPSHLDADNVEWVVNDIAELGVKIGDQFFFLYKGHSLVYETAEHDDGRPMHWRPVFKREFGECAHPINYSDPTQIGTVSLGDSDEWQRLPSIRAPRTSDIRDG